MTPDRLRELADEATPGPWRAEDNSMSIPVFGRVKEGVARTLICEIDTSYDLPFDRGECEADARLIASLGPDAARLLADAMRYVNEWPAQSTTQGLQRDGLLARFERLGGAA